MKTKTENKSKRSEFGLELESRLREALEMHKGRFARKYTVDNTEVEPVEEMAPEKIREIQNKFDVSAMIFGKLLGASEKTIHAWVSGQRKPNAYAYRLLEIFDKHPKIAKQLIHSKK